MKPLAIELFAGLSGWGAGLIAEGFHVIAFDIVDMFRETGARRPRGIELVIQDVLTIHGKQFRDAELICSSSPCQEFSYRSLPFKCCKAKTPEVLPAWWEKPEPKMEPEELAEWKAYQLANPLDPPMLGLELFHAQFRIQREASEAAGRHIPLVVENVRGAQKWVGLAPWHFKSFFLFGDVPAMMPYPGNDGVKLPNNGSPRRFDQRKRQRLSRGNGDPASAHLAKIPFELARYIASVYYPK